MPTKQITWLEISKKALRHNIQEFKKILPRQTALMAVVKANAYGHGFIESARTFASAGCSWLGTVNLDEALELRRHGMTARILVFSYFHPAKLREALLKNITLTVYGYQTARRLSVLAGKLHRTVPIHIKIDTGAARLGLSPIGAVSIIKNISKLRHLKIEGIFSHLADAENPNQAYTNKQIIIFSRLITELTEEGIRIPLQHIACSAATLLNTASRFNLVRLGISAYGLWSIERDGRHVEKIHRSVNLQPALSWHTTVIQVKDLPAGSSIGYGRTFRTKTRTKIAILPVGYAEGYDRRFSNKGVVLIHGHRCPVRGRVCMNLTMVDVSKLKNVHSGDQATLIGRQRRTEISADELAKKINSINYEVVARINPLLPRLFT